MFGQPFGLLAVYVSRREQATSAVAALGLVSLIAYVLVVGLRAELVSRGRDALVAVFVSRPPPPPPEPERRTVKPRPSSAPKGEPAPPNLKNEATPVVAPRLRPIIVPPPIAAAPMPAAGHAASSGASDRPGPGQGAGGTGDGFGGGGDGGDGGGGAVVGPRQIRGKLSFRDLPEGLLQPGDEARVGVRYTVNVDGTVSNCRADQPSGTPALDTLACRLIEQRFRFRPARDRQGRPVRATIVEAHSWFIREERPRG